MYAVQCPDTEWQELHICAPMRARNMLRSAMAAALGEGATGHEWSKRELREYLEAASGERVELEVRGCDALCA